MIISKINLCKVVCVKLHATKISEEIAGRSSTIVCIALFNSIMGGGLWIIGGMIQ
jgi:hypothetical protein